MTKIIRGRIPGLIKIFFYKLKETVVIRLPEKGNVVIHTDGTITISHQGRKKI